MEYLEQIKKELKKLKPNEGILENIKRECRAFDIAKKEKTLEKSFAFFKNRRNFISVIAVSLVAVFASAILLLVFLSGYDNPNGYTAGLEYKLIDNKFYEVGIGTADDKDIIIPSKYNDIPVQRIAQNGFKNTDIKSIIVPDSIVSIEGNAIYKDGELKEGAFYGCNNLTSVVLSEKLVSIGIGAFAECKALESIEIPKSVTDIKACAFYGSGLKSIMIPLGVENIETNVFAYCENLTYISIPYSVKNIKDGAFAFCSSLTNITIPDKVKSIGAGAFSSCTGLRNIVIPESVIIIGANAFSNCKNLIIYAEAVSRPSGWSDDLGNGSIDWGYKLPVLIYDLINGNEYEVSKGSKSVDVIIIPGEYNGLPVTRIADNAFSYSEIINIIIPSSIKTIGKNAFIGCVNLTSTIIPKSVTVIKENAFDVSVTIYAEIFNKPSGWAGYWQMSRRPVVWGCELSQDKTYVVSFVVTGIIKPSVLYYAPCRIGYYFVNWESESNNNIIYYGANDIYNAESNSTLTAIWKEI